MPAQTKGSICKVRNGYGIRRPEDGRRSQETGLGANTETRDWFDENVKPRLSRRAPSAGITQRGPYCLRHTFATEALAAGMGIFELAPLMGSSVAVIDETHGHLARGSEQRIRERLEARTDRSGAPDEFPLPGHPDVATVLGYASEDELFEPACGAVHGVARCRGSASSSPRTRLR